MINCVVIKCLWLSFVPGDNTRVLCKICRMFFLYYVDVKITNIMVVELNIKM
jgi:hypothetical protein